MPLVLPLFGALIAVCCVLAVYEFTNGVVHVLRKIPYVGKYVANLADAALLGIYVVLQKTFALTARIFWQVFAAPFTAVYNFISWVEHAVTAGVNAAQWIAITLIPAEVGKLRDLITAAIHTAHAYAAGLVASVRAELARDIGHAEDLAKNLAKAAEAEAAHALHEVKVQVYGSIHDVENLARHLATAATADAAKALAGVKTQVYGSIHAVEGAYRAADTDLTKLVTSTAVTTLGAAEHYTDLAIKTIKGIVVVDIPGVVAPVYDGLIEDVGVLGGVIATDFPDLSSLLDALPSTDGLTTAASIAGALTIARVMTRYLSECGIGNCRNLSGIGRAFQDLFGIVEGGAFLALLAELIADPQGAAQDLDSFLSPIVDPLVSAGRELLGV